jgi:CheY-like chemotaxis protein
MFAVSDTGVGMTDEIKAQIFEPFFTTKEPGKGTGLGLSTVYGIVKQNNGFIWLYSELGIGTSFKIYLPAVEIPEPVYDSTPTAEPIVPAGRATILLVEDERALREVISEFLRSAGHTVIAVESHDEAVERVAQHRGTIDLLLTDIVLKGLNGKQLAENLQATGCKFKVIFMSGYTPNASVHESLLDESTMFLQKPFTRPTLLARVHETLSS